MSMEFNERLRESLGEQAQVWIVGTREQVNQIISEMYVRQMISDREQFSPLLPVPISPGKYMSVLIR